ncbi:TMP-TENI-domain-containing protein [Sporormia fimetaria CBS 119925]|uniref:TMP-TENI-domain-containing protein n=1 Tax=Sporormia fimetaria CBS 119925 TaxID=1340428 RepID=A0A6A6V0Y8_9PLEO|nr:TMP-TENI-domain-containing protein [Sporormia fimetaria CBS 119925]
MAAKADYSIYLVTDSTPAILGDRDLVQVVEEALKGGVTFVQYREKTSDTGALISTGKALHQVCQKYSVPLVINDRVDVALAVGCEGVHLGQDDMRVDKARELLGSSAIIGATVSSMEEARIAVDLGADYLGIGTVYATNTKKNTKDIIGVNGVRRINHFLERQEDEAAKNIKTVCIGGINLQNIALVKSKLASWEFSASNHVHWEKTIDGVAIVSAIAAQEDPKAAAAALKKAWTDHSPFLPESHPSEPDVSSLGRYVKDVHQRVPLSHNMTNLVVQNFAASVALAIGSSPIMSNNGQEAGDLGALQGGLVINMGTSTPDNLNNQRQAIQAYNARGRPVVLDPVGAGATDVRRKALQFLMDSGHFSVIKGNEREILAVSVASGYLPRESVQQRGVDSGDSLLSLEEKAYYISRLASREQCIVVMTGAVDVLSDGHTTWTVENGHPYLGSVTGSGCTLGTMISAYLACDPRHRLAAVLAAMLHFEIAAEDAAVRSDVHGPGTFVPAFVDELYKKRMDVVEGSAAWLDRRKIRHIENISDLGLLKEY